MRRWIVFVVIAAGCTSTPIPATAPPLPSTTSSSTTTTVTTTTTTLPPSTTTVDRRAEVEAILLDLQTRRFWALYDGDREAFAELYANDGYLEVDLGSFDLIAFTAAPDELIVEVDEILVDRPDCIAVKTFEDYRSFLGPDAVGTRTVVLERTPWGTWGFSYVGTGWLCDGPHPLGS